MPKSAPLNLHWWRRPGIRIAPDADALCVTLQEGLFLRSSRTLHRRIVSPSTLLDHNELLVNLQQAIEDSGVTGRGYLPVAVTLPDQLFRMWMVTPPANAASLADCQAAATLRFVTLYGASPSHYAINADWDARLPFLACSMPIGLLDRVKAICSASGLIMTRVEPQFVTVWNRHCSRLQPQAWIATLNDHLLTLGALHQGRLVALRSTAVPTEQLQERSWLEMHIRREALLLNMAVPSVLQVVGRMPLRWQKNDGESLQCLALEPNLS